MVNIDSEPVLDIHLNGKSVMLGVSRTALAPLCWTVMYCSKQQCTIPHNYYFGCTKGSQKH